MVQARNNHTDNPKPKRPASLPQHDASPESPTDGVGVGGMQSQNLLYLQRTIGNRATSQLVQRMATSTELKQVAGEPKKDVKFLFTWRKMSQRYKRVLDALDAYHDQLTGFGFISTVERLRQQVGAELTGKLDAVLVAANAYVGEHDEADEERAPHLQKIITDAGNEKLAVQRIIETDIYARQSWKTTVGALGRLKGDVQSGAFNKNLTHGTSSSLLGNFSGEMMTGQELENRGIVTNSGEGDFYSTGGGGGAKQFISAGEGLPGIGTAAAYANAVTEFEDYNPALYHTSDLRQEMLQIITILRRWDDNLNKIPNDDIMKAKREKSQFEGLLKKLKREWEYRKTLPPDHPRQKGEPYSDSTYPLVFEFTPDDLDVTNPRPQQSLRMDTDSQRPLGGERSVKPKSPSTSIDFRVPGRLVRVYCPAEQMDAVRSKMRAIVGHSGFDVLPMEEIDLLSEATKWTRVATMETMQTLYAKTRQLVLHAYAQGMSSGEEVNKNLLATVGPKLQVLDAMARGATKVSDLMRETGFDKEKVTANIKALMADFGVRSVSDMVRVGRERGMISAKATSGG